MLINCQNIEHCCKSMYTLHLDILQHLLSLAIFVQYLSILVHQKILKFKLLKNLYFSTGEAYCEARLIYDGLEVQPGQSLGDLYQGFEKYSISGLPMPLPDKPLITQVLITLNFFSPLLTWP
jgi:hypothetical protein